MAHLVYIVSPGHSGSTTLTMLLGQIKGVFAAGELMFLPWQLDRDGKTGDPIDDLTLCTCGKSFQDCPAWGTAIPSSAFEDAFRNFRLSFLENQEWKAMADGRFSRAGMLIYRRLIVRGITPIFMRPIQARRIARRNFDLIDRVGELTDSRAVVDSTKSLVHFHLLNRFRKSSMIVITRDPRGLSASAIKYKRDPVKVLAAWLHNYERILGYIEANKPTVYWVTYEQMCSAPDIVKRFFADRLVDPGTVIERDDDFEFHLVAGNPSRYRPFHVREDTSWTQVLPPDIRSNIERQWHRVESIYRRLEANCELVPGMPPVASIAPHAK